MMKMNQLVVLLLFTLCLIAPLGSATLKSVEYCNKKTNYPVKVSGVDITPYPISRGKVTTFAIAASTDDTISGGKLSISVKYFFFNVHSETKDLCGGTSCPIPAGNFTVSHSQELPGITPPGSYNLQMTMVDENKKQLTCIKFDFSIGFIAEDSVAVASI